ncbi:hypothetical protein SAMN05216303_11150 [Rhodoferax sp. OV413]|uniref:hypothetical protein n=1 Tax=Rhodoferax sp. OV413 TaxID=1855285 RepID=UPI000884687B|nr:hypothetical protein [Rhodoferax sp. OV413]SDP93017.1 hypothetical protein SAMN05216303_11150 [Rhodoferax sp. OV413]
MGQNEAAGIEVLKEILRDKARKAGGQFNAYPLGPQDRKVLADDIFAAADYFAIVESKWSEDQLSTEAKDKAERVKRLCEGLVTNSAMAELHAKCHKIAWRDSATGLSMLQPYRDVVCVDSWPSTCVALNKSSPFDAEVFADAFFGNPPGHCVRAADFIRYVKWLLKTVTGADDKSVVVLARETNSQGKSISKEITLENLSIHLTKLAATRATAAVKRAEQKATRKLKGP